jgi:hypothetical protein
MIKQAAKPLAGNPALRNLTGYPDCIISVESKGRARLRLRSLRGLETSLLAEAKGKRLQPEARFSWAKAFR